MDLQNLSLFQMGEEKMRWLAQRQNVIAQNIANADTPKYMPSEVEPIKFRELLGETEMTLTRTNSKHFDGTTENVRLMKTNINHLSPVPDGKKEEFKQRRPFETSIDKNGVILEEQMQKMDDTRSQHEQVSALFKKNMALLGTALGK
ncbi:MAG: flagellar basal body protein [Alphaproteobacteria bacterium]|nr:flagellar basal body protein [Alphaproteobacteria bacterium]